MKAIQNVFTLKIGKTQFYRVFEKQRLEFFWIRRYGTPQKHQEFCRLPARVVKFLIPVVVFAIVAVV